MGQIFSGLTDLYRQQAQTAAGAYADLFTPVPGGGGPSDEDRIALGTQFLREMNIPAPKAIRIATAKLASVKAEEAAINQDRANKQRAFDVNLEGAQTENRTRSAQADQIVRETQPAYPQVITVESGEGSKDTPSAYGTPSWLTDFMARAPGESSGNSSQAPSRGGTSNGNVVSFEPGRYVPPSGYVIGRPAYSEIPGSETGKGLKKPSQAHLNQLRAMGLSDLADDLAAKDAAWRSASDATAPQAQADREEAARKYDAARAGQDLMPTPKPSAKPGQITPAQRLQVQTLKTLWRDAEREASKAISDEEMTTKRRDADRAERTYFDYVDQITGGMPASIDEEAIATPRARPGTTDIPTAAEAPTRQPASGLFPLDPNDQRVQAVLTSYKAAGVPPETVEDFARATYADDPEALTNALALIARIWAQ